MNDGSWLHPATRPILHRAGERAVILLHGFTASPQEMHVLARALAGAGWTAYVPRLPGHGTCLADLMRTRWRDWAFAAEDAWHTLTRAGYRPLAAVGLSMGGALALHLASRLPLAATVAIAAPYTLRHFALHWLWRWLPWIQWPKTDWVPFPDDPSQWEEAHWTYSAYPFRGLAELSALLHDLHYRLPHIHIPTLLLYAQGDPVVPLQHQKAYAQRIAGPVETEVLPTRRHVLTLGPTRHEVARRVLAFLNRVTRARTSAQDQTHEP
ncbi:MAG: alpha/beta fold hydrolase [Chloroflexi bacterium]|nr:alpha/beta fold hydrolase [Chloroflexota bacterium]